MSRKQHNKIEYFVACIGEFAKRHGFTLRQSFDCLDKFKGLSSLEQIYDTEHLFSIDDAIDDLTLICKRNGATLA